MLKFIFIFFAIILNVTLTAQDFEWVKSSGGISTGLVTVDDSGLSIAVDDLGNVYTTGFFSNTSDFDPNAGVNNVTSLGGKDIYITKQDASGNLVWVKTIGGTGNDVGFGIALDKLNNIYITGYFNGTIDFDPGATTYTTSSNGSDDSYVLKLNSSGNFVWAYAFGGLGSEKSKAICLDALNNIHITGYFNQTVDFDAGSGTANLTSKGGNDIFVAKISSAGNYIWAKSMGGGLGDVGNSLTLDLSGNVYSTGYFNGTADFDPSAVSYTLTSKGAEDFYISKLSNSGDFIWTKAIGGTGTDIGNCIVIDSMFSDPIITGVFTGTVNFNWAGFPSNNLVANNASGNAFLLKMTNTGSGWIYAKSIGGGYCMGSSMTIDNQRNLYLTGIFNGTVDFDPGTSVYNLVSSTSAVDIFTAKMTFAGAQLSWASKAVTSSYPKDVYAIAVDNINNSLYISGVFGVNSDFDPTNAAAVQSTNGNSGYDIFLSKYHLVTIKPTANKDSICNGESTILSASGASTYTWQPGNYIGANYTVSPNATTIYTVSGTSSLGTIASTEITVKVYTKTISITPAISNICVGNTITLGAGGSTSYTWNPGNKIGSSVVFSPTVTTSYTVNALSSIGCISNSIAKIIVNNIPTANISPSSFTMCEGNSTALAANISPQTNYVTLANGTPYNIPDNNTTGITSYITVSGATPSVITNSLDIQVTVNIKHSYDGDLCIYLIAPDGTQYSLSLYNGSMDSDYINTTFWSGASTYISNGIAPFTGSFTPQKSLASLVGKSMNGIWGLKVTDKSNSYVGTLNNWSLSFTNTNTYTWSPNSGISNISTLSPTINPVSNTIYSLTTSNYFGCSTTNTTSITVIPFTTSILNPINKTVCQNQTAVFTSNLSGGQWEMKSPTGNWTTINNNSVFTGATTKTLSVLATNQFYSNYLFRCSVSNMCTTLYSNSATLIINTPISVYNNKSICKGTSYNIGSHSYSKTGIYIDTLMRANNCDSIVTTNLSFYPDNHKLTVDGGNTDIRNYSMACGDIVNLNVIGGFNTGTIFSWTPNTTLASSKQSSTYAYPSSNTSYFVNFIDTYNCSIVDTIDVTITNSCIGSMGLSSDSVLNKFDTIAVSFFVNNAVDLYSLYPHLIFDNNYLTFVSSVKGTIMGTNIINTAPVLTNNSIDFGITKTGASSGLNGSGSFYKFYFTTNNLSIPDNYLFNFYVDNTTAYNSLGQNIDLRNTGIITVRYTNTVNVWPGDLNYSKKVTVADLLPIGYFYNSSGSTRPNAALGWYAQPATIWGSDKTTKNSSAYKVFADGNGDGIISLSDQTAIGFNLSKLHARYSSLSSNKRTNNTIASISSNPIYKTIPGSLPQTVQMSLDLSATNPINSMYGIAFHLLFDQNKLDISNINYNYASSIFGNYGTNFISIENSNTPGQIDIGMTRYSASNVITNGHLLNISFTVNQANADTIPIQLVVEDANDNLGNPLSVANNVTYLINPGYSTGIKTINEAQDINFAPNPTNGLVNIWGKYLGQSNLSVFNNLGQKILEREIINKSNYLNETINLSNMPTGVYYIKMTSSNQIQNFRIILDHVE